MGSILKQLLIVAVLAGVAAWAIQTRTEDPADGERGGRPATGVEVALARADQVERVVAAVGTGRALRSVELRFSSSGRVAEVLFEDGDAVSEGDVLARLEEDAQRAALAEAEAALAEAEAAFERARSLEAQGRIAGAAFDAAQSELLRARARRDRATTELDDRTLRAPFDGVIGFSEIDPGAVVGPETVIGTLDDISRLDVQFSIPERFFGEVEAGDAVRATTRIFPGEVFDGAVRAIDRRVDEVSRAFRVRARFENPGLRLPAGAFMQVELVLESREGVLAPEEALVTEAGAVHLFVVGPDDRIEKRRVRVGGRRAGEAEVLEGLEAGERVVTRGVQKVRDGAEVRILNADELKGGGGDGQVRDGAARGDARSAG
jgi:membrane fusion protein (multidrug efflux system)